jgi:arginase
LKIRIITTDSVAGTPGGVDPARLQGLAGASAAYLAHGLTERLAGTGAEIDGVTRVESPAERPADPIADLAAVNARVAAAVTEGRAGGAAPLLAGGNCSHIIGMIGGLQQSHGATTRIGLLWLDAHGDFNTPATTLSGMHGGMPVAVAAGLCLPEWREGGGQLVPLPAERIVMVDVRNLDEAEERLIRATSVEIARFGSEFDITPVTEAIDRLAASCDLLYVHVDADILDASLQPNHPTAEPDGPTLEPVITVLRHAFATGKVGAFAVVSVNPDGEAGQISLESGMRMVVEGVRAWAEE